MTRELSVFLFMIAMGAVFSLLYDFMRAMHLYLKNKEKFVIITDVIYWIVVSYLLIFGIAYINNGVIRWYEFVGIGLGVSLYILTISRFVYSILCIIIGFIVKIIGYICKFFLTVSRFLYKMIIVPVVFGIGRLKSRLQSIGSSQ